MRIKIIALCAGLMLIAGGASAQEGDGGARAPSGAPPAAAAPANANAIKPGSTLPPRGANGFGAGAPVPGLYRENPGNGFYGAYSGVYQGQM